MTPSFTLLFPTKKLYQCPEWTEYHKAVNQYLENTLPPEYFAQSTAQRWSTLIDAFSKKIQLANWDSFKSKRLGTIVGSYTLSLAEVLSCFEQFYFLWGTDHETFKFSSPRQRQEFLKTLTEVLNPDICEPGIITRIQTLLNTYRSDSDWIMKELSNQRMLIIEKIAVQYNTEHRISNGFEIHTLTHMLKLAAQKSLGIDTGLIKNDAYLNHISAANINTYFEGMYLSYFKHYEDGVIYNLAQHILYQLQHDPLNTLDVSDWNQQDLILNEEKTKVFFPKLNLFFRHYFIEDALQSILTVSDETNCITLFSKEKLLPIFEKMIEKKLIEEQFFIPFEQLTEENIENTFILRNIKNINLKHLLLFLKQFQSEHHDLYKMRQLLSKNIEFIQAYPELILPTLSTNPQYGYAFPRKLQQQFLPYSPTNDDRTQVINQLKNTRHLSLLKLKQLSPSISPGQLLAIITHRHDNQLPPLPECDENTLKHFITVLCLSHNGEWSPDYSQFRERIIKTFTPSDQYFSLFNEQYYRQLAEASVIQSSQWLDAYFSFKAQNLIYNKPFSSLHALNDQLQLTAKIHLSFLSSCLLYSSDLLRIVATGLVLFYLDRYYTFYFNYYIFSPLFYSVILPGATTLFLSLWAIQFSVFIAISYLCLSRLPHLDSLTTRIIFTYLLYAFFDPCFFIGLLLDYEVQMLCCYLAVTVFTLTLALTDNQPWSINTIHHHALDIFSKLLFWPSFILGYFVLIHIQYVPTLIHYSTMIFNCTVSWIGRITATLSGPFSTIAPTETDALKIKIENNIERLLNTDSLSANIKGDLLNILWTQIQQEVEGSEGQVSLQTALHKTYSFSRYGTDYSTSFIDVAKTHRTNNENFKLDQPKTQYMFFSSKTTTENELGDYLNHPAALG